MLPRLLLLLLLLMGLLWLSATPAQAGMPAPLPTHVPRWLRLGDSAIARLQAISFFVVVFGLCCLAVQMLWNTIRRDFPSLPRLTYPGALAGVFLWGLLFVIVLTMISGARELMTPGAWEKQGFTYKLANAPPAAPATPGPEMLRRQHLEELRTRLWQFAATHMSRFPTADETTTIPNESWQVPDAGGLRYGYVAGLSASHAPAVLASEPELDSVGRLVLFTNGDIKPLTTLELNALLTPEVRP